MKECLVDSSHSLSRLLSEDKCVFTACLSALSSMSKFWLNVAYFTVYAKMSEISWSTISLELRKILSNVNGILIVFGAVSASYGLIFSSS